MKIRIVISKCWCNTNENRNRFSRCKIKSTIDWLKSRRGCSRKQSRIEWGNRLITLFRVLIILSSWRQISILGLWTNREKEKWSLWFHDVTRVMNMIRKLIQIMNAFHSMNLFRIRKKSPNSWFEWFFKDLPFAFDRHEIDCLKVNNRMNKIDY